MPHLAIMGDPVFDNAAYVGGGPSVADQVNLKLPAGWTAELLARDGAVIANIADQIRASVRLCPSASTTSKTSPGFWSGRSETTAEYPSTRSTF